MKIFKGFIDLWLNFELLEYAIWHLLHDVAFWFALSCQEKGSFVHESVQWDVQHTHSRYHSRLRHKRDLPFRFYVSCCVIRGYWLNRPYPTGQARDTLVKSVNSRHAVVFYRYVLVTVLCTGHGILLYSSDPTEFDRFPQILFISWKSLCRTFTGILH